MFLYFHTYLYASGETLVEMSSEIFVLECASKHSEMSVFQGYSRDVCLMGPEALTSILCIGKKAQGDTQVVCGGSPL